MEDFVRRNMNVWAACFKGPSINICSETSYLSAACKRFPTIVSKVVRLRLNQTRSLLKDKRLKIIYLVRDPRATMTSRRARDWCLSSDDCGDSSQLCDDLLSDLNTYDHLSKNFPDRFMFVKYEDLSRRPLETFEQVFEFADLDLTPGIMEAIDKQTKYDHEWASSTSRKSIERIDRWKKLLSRWEMDEIQQDCAKVLHKLNYII